MEIALGQTLRDLVTGYTGIATQQIDFQNGNTQYALQGKVKEGECDIPDAYLIDTHMVEFVDAGVSERARCVHDIGNINLGDKVRDRASGVEGIAVTRSYFLNGCVYLTVQPARPDNSLFGSNPDVVFAEANRFEVVKKGLMKMLKNAINPKTGLHDGGPSTKVSRAKVRTA